MIPAFDANDYLPPGIHPATLSELDERFGRSSELRRVEMESVRWLVDAARRAGATRLVINGSFVTDVLEPNDVDCALLVDDAFPAESSAAGELAAGFPFVGLQIVRDKGFRFLVEELYASDRVECPKGMVEIELWP